MTPKCQIEGCMDNRFHAAPANKLHLVHPYDHLYDCDLKTLKAEQQAWKRFLKQNQITSLFAENPTTTQ